MCGIVGYIGQRNATEVLLDGLSRLEYRGYDSAGLAVLTDGTLASIKAAGRVDALRQRVDSDGASDGSQGIAHTRWATHGPPTEANAHPHLDDSGRFAVVHNGIIENYQSLRSSLQKKGHTFHSDTDTEVLAHLIAECYDGDLAAAVAAAVRQVEGTFGIAVVSADHPGELVAARKGSPIVIGLGQSESFIASDAAAIIAYTDRVIFLDDNDIAHVTASEVNVRDLQNIQVDREIAKISWDVEAIEKGGYEHFMLKEIFDQPQALHNAIRGRLDHEGGNAYLSGLNMTPQDLAGIQRIIIAACGTSMHAAMVGEFFFEDLAHLVTEVEQAAEFRYRNPIIDGFTLALAVSQSGETADTLAALREAKMKGAQVAGLCNVVGSTIAREAGRGIYLHAGPEIGVASTKAFTCQVAVMLMMALKFARSRRLTRQHGVELAAEIERLPEYVQTVLDQADQIAAIARRHANSHDWFFIGRGTLYPVALEGALKLKEISYQHAEGYHAAELKHGPIALLQEDVPVVALANDPESRDKMMGNIQECHARKAPLIVCAGAGDEEIASLGGDIIEIPACSKYISPIPTVVALQLLSYFVAKELGCDIDKPRNLAKSVTVE